jgi:5-methyltetrahydrofolate--homocysteine methyltransferase
METIISSGSKELIISSDRPVAIIGERINPSGRKKMQEALMAGDLGIVRDEAIAQTQAGADILDVNTAVFGTDEAALLSSAVQAVMEVTDLPLCIDSPTPEALEAALKVYKGKALINSTTAEEQSLSKVLPLVKEYDAVVIGLPQDENGIPGEAEGRVVLAHKIVERAEAMGINRDRIIIDCLALAIGADPNSCLKAVETTTRIRNELGVNTTLAVSNLSFGMPDRDLLNNAFAATIIAAGATCLIADAAKIRPIITASDLLMAHDKRARRYIGAFHERQSV